MPEASDNSYPWRIAFGKSFLMLVGGTQGKCNKPLDDFPESAHVHPCAVGPGNGQHISRHFPLSLPLVVRCVGWLVVCWCGGLNCWMVVVVGGWGGVCLHLLGCVLDSGLLALRYSTSLCTPRCPNTCPILLKSAPNLAVLGFHVNS